MPPVTNQDVTKIMRGFPVRVYLDPTFNADGTVKNIQADGSLLIADHANAVELGFTQDGAELTVSREREGLPVDQRTTPILPALTTQTPHLKVGYLQVLDFETLAKLTPGSQFIDTATHAGVSNTTDQSIPLHSVAAIAPSAAEPTLHQVLIIYACSNIADLVLKLEKAYHKMPVDFQGEDAGRADGKTWLAYVTKPVAP